MIEWKTVDSFTGNRSDDRTVRPRSCPVCQHDKASQVLVFADFQYFTDSAEIPKRVDLTNVMCDRCYAVFLNPVLTPFGFQSFFTEAGQSYGATAGRAAEQRAWLAERGMLADGSTLLDVGCYDGDFLAQLPETINRVGVDIDEPSIQRGRERHGARGVDFILGDFDTFQMTREPDTIVLFHVLEHLPDPVTTLANLRRNSASHTRLVVEVPILENGFTNDINGFMSAQHMTHFSRRSLRNCFLRAGWNPIEMFEQPSYNGCRVVATPAEAQRSVEGDPADRGLHAKYIEHWRGVTRAVDGRAAALGSAKRIVVWGGGLHTEFLYQHTSVFDVAGRQFLIVDSDRMKQGKSWRGINILAPESLAEVDWAQASLIVSSYGGQRQIAKAAIALGVPDEKIIQLYDRFVLY